MKSWTDPDRRALWAAALALTVGLSLFMSVVIYGYTGPLRTGVDATRTGAAPAAADRTGIGGLPRSALGELANTAVIGGGVLAIAGCVLLASRPRGAGRSPERRTD